MKTQNIDIPFNNYVTIFNVLTADCAATETTCINLESTPSKKEVCQSVEMGKGKPKASNKTCYDKEVTVKMQHFETEECIIQKWKLTNHVEAKSEKANFFFLLDYISKCFPKIINHKNHLKNHYNTIHLFREHFNTIYFDKNFSENTKIPVKFESQFLQ